jgi:Na+-transporting NADH:ubiquinone oxidoreductase subunit C
VRYTVLFATVVCVVCAALIATAAVLTLPGQVANALLYKEKNVLLAAGLVEPGARSTRRRSKPSSTQSIQARLVTWPPANWCPKPGTDARRYDQRVARDDPATSRVAPAKCRRARLPNQGIVYLVKKAGSVDQIVIAIEGLGMWGTIYGFMALAPTATPSAA